MVTKKEVSREIFTHLIIKLCSISFDLGLSSLRDSVLGDCHSLPFESSHHKLKSISKFHKSELCAVCEKNMVLFTQGFKCSGKIRITKY